MDRHLQRILSSLFSTRTLALLFGVCFAWLYLPVMRTLITTWHNNADYSHGFFVPLFSLYLLWHRRQQILISNKPTWLGFLILVVGISMNAVGSCIYFEWLEALSLLPSLLGFCVIIAGRSIIAWSWLPIAFLFFMIPLPFQLETAITIPLQTIATQGSTYVLHVLGFLAIPEGNMLHIGETRLSVTPACGGLSMVISFLSISAMICLLSQRTNAIRLFTFLSALPIAVIANVVRIVLTAVLYVNVDNNWAEYVFHDLAGWFMIPFGFFLLWLELKIVSWIISNPTTNLNVPQYAQL